MSTKRSAGTDGESVSASCRSASTRSMLPPTVASSHLVEVQSVQPGVLGVGVGSSGSIHENHRSTGRIECRVRKRAREMSV